MILESYKTVVALVICVASFIAKGTTPLVRYVLFVAVVATLLCFSTGTPTYSGLGENHRCNQTHLTALDREIAAHRWEPRYVAALRGLRWCVLFCQDDGNFESSFVNYLAMLDELTLHHPRPGLLRIVHELILDEFERARPRLPHLFSADAEGLEAFVLILPIAYHHQIPLAPLKSFAKRRFKQVVPVNRLEQFHRAAQKRDYGRMTDLVVGAAFVDMAYRFEAEKAFPLPQNVYPRLIADCASIPFASPEGTPGYLDQNHYATHLLLALNHCGQKRLKPSPVADRVFFYLVKEYDAVRNRVGDLDLLCEYLYCLRQFGPEGVGFIDEGERYVMSLQRPDGGWGALHPTRTAITLLAQG